MSIIVNLDVIMANSHHMKAQGNTVEEILFNLPEDRLKPFNKLHEVILKNLPKRFEPATSYGGLGYVVPHKLYPAGYHCKAERHCLLPVLPRKKDPLIFTTWEFILIINY